MTPVCNPASFHNEAAYQRVCGHCGRFGAFQAHHVVDKQTLRVRCGIVGDAAYDTRNALRLCAPFTNNNCHMQFENRRIEIRLTSLTDDNIDYAFEVLGAYAYEYLHREYAGEDARVERKLGELQEAA